MSAGDVSLLVVRWVHLTAAVALVGSGLFYVLVLRPLAKGSPENLPLGRLMTSREFQDMVNTAVLLLLITGVILIFDRLTSNLVGVPYVSVLSVKIALSLVLFYLATSRRRRIHGRGNGEESREGSKRRGFTSILSGANVIVTLGIAIFFLAELLRWLVENSLKGG